MKLITLLENTGWTKAYHGGGNFDTLTMDHIGKGENNHFLGPGVYFATDPNTAKSYMQYSKDPRFYECEIDMSGIYDPVKGLPQHMRGIGDRMAQSIGFDSIDHMPTKNANSLQYGKWPIGPLVQHLGTKQAHALFKEFGLHGMLEPLASGGLEIAVYNPDIIRHLKQTTPPD